MSNDVIVLWRFFFVLAVSKCYLRPRLIHNVEGKYPSYKFSYMKTHIIYLGQSAPACSRAPSLYLGVTALYMSLHA